MGNIAEALGAEYMAEPARLLALRLHALHEDDRNWILSQIAQPARGTLVELIDELKQLGFSDLPATMNNEPAGKGHKLDGDAATVVDQASPELIWHLLRTEPLAIRRCLLAARPWKWSAELYRKQGLVDPDISKRAEQNQTITPRVRQALIVALADWIAGGEGLLVVENRATTAKKPPKLKLLERFSEGVKAKFSWQR